MSFDLKPIGVISTPFKESQDTPIQSIFSDTIGEVTLFEDYVEGLYSLDQFTHVYLLFWCHRAKEPTMMVTPYLDDISHGLFSTRAPSRPNPIGLSIVRIIEIRNDRFTFLGADMLDESPLLDIKPYISKFDCFPDASSGWLEKRLSLKDDPALADDRFEE